MDFTAFDPNTGRVRRNLSAPTAQDARHMVMSDEVLLAGMFRASEYLLLDGIPTVQPPVVVVETYTQQRRKQYPPISDQLDMLWHAMDTGEIPKCQAFYAALTDVKNKFPKI